MLAYYFPPLGGSGVQRVAKLVRYLPLFGWQPHVVTARPGRYLARDASLLDEVEGAGALIHRTPSLDPTRLGRGVAGAGALGDGRRRLAGAVTGAFFVPDNKIGWLPFALRAARRAMQKEAFSVIFSSAPPYTSHLVAARLGRETGVPVVLDYRDAWLENPRHHYPTAWHRQRHDRQERAVLERAAAVTAINAPIAALLRARTPSATPVAVVPQGFDPADFHGPPAAPLPGKMRVVFTGMFYHAQRPDTFLDGLARALAAHPEMAGRVEAVFAGRVPAHFDALVARRGLESTVRFAGYLPHARSVALARSADLLWMTVGDVPGAHLISTSKLFEYVGTGRPILGLVPPGDAADALAAYGCGTTVHPDDAAGVARALWQRWQAWRVGETCAPDAAYQARHDRRQIAHQVAQLFDGLA